MKRQHLLIGSAVLVVALAATGCSSTASTDSSASPSPSASTSTEKKDAWVRGTKVTLTNSSGSAVQYGDSPGAGDTTPTVTYSTLANGKSASALDEWKSASGTNIFYRVKYPDGKVAEFEVFNPGIGSPGVNYRTGPMGFDWSNADFDQFTLSENETKTVTVAEHSITFTQSSQDDDNKNWTVTLN